MEEQNKLVVFQEKEIRRAWHKEEWWFVVVDVIEPLDTYEKETGNKVVTEKNFKQQISEAKKLEHKNKRKK